MKNCSVFASLISPSKMILFEKKYQTFDTVFHHQMKHCVSCLIYYFNNKSPCLICFQVYRILYLIYSTQLRDLVDWHAHDIAEVLSIIAESSATVTILKATTSSSVRTASVKNAVAAEVTIMTGMIGSRQFGVCKKI